MVKFRSMCKDKRRLGMLALAVSLLLGLFGPVHGNAIHFVRGLFLGMALVLMISSLYGGSYQGKRLSL